VSKSDILLAAVAALVAGAMSMAAGEYVSVSSQADTEKADLSREKEELRTNPDAEQAELAAIYVKRGLDQNLARQVARELMEKDALAAHARDELGISKISVAQPIQAALTSAACFSVGAAMPVLAVLLAPAQFVVLAVASSSMIYLAFLGIIGAKAGGAAIVPATIRVTFWGAMAMAVTAGIGLLIGRAV
jgi:VIT1/CCC1 family predicted Fe2+/Mn2+ transporter